MQTFKVVNGKDGKYRKMGNTESLEKFSMWPKTTAGVAIWQKKGFLPHCLPEDSQAQEALMEG